MRLDQLEQLRRSPNRSPKRKRDVLTLEDVGSLKVDASKKLELKLDVAADENLKLMKTTDQLVVGVTATISEDSRGDDGSEMKIGGGADAAAFAASFSAVTPTPSNDTAVDIDNDAGNWEYIDRAENIVFQFQENEDPSSYLPYTLEVIWIHEDCEYFVANDADAILGGEECSEKFVSLIERTARRATNMKAFLVRYNNKLDRTWPYTKVSRIAEIVSRAKGPGTDAILESVDDDYFEYIVKLVPERKKGDCGSSFFGRVDFSHMDDVKKYYVLDYIGGDAMDLMM